MKELIAAQKNSPHSGKKKQSKGQNTRILETSPSVEEKPIEEEQKTPKSSLISSSPTSEFKKFFSTINFVKATVIINENNSELFRQEFVPGEIKSILRGLPEEENVSDIDYTKYPMKIILTKKGNAQTIPLDMTDVDVRTFCHYLIYKNNLKMIADHNLDLPSSDPGSNRKSLNFIEKYKFLTNSLELKEAQSLKEQVQNPLAHEQ